MAMFKKSEPQAQKPRERPAPTSRHVGDAAISIIGSGMQVVGDISTEGIVRVEGQVRGTIRAGTSVVLGQAGTIEGNVHTADAIIGGRVNGSVVASNRLELQSTCTVEGEIRTRAEHLKLEEGARFAGQVHMIEEEVPVPTTPQLMSGDNSPRKAADENRYEKAEEATPVESLVVVAEEEKSEESEEQDVKRKKAEAR